MENATQERIRRGSSDDSHIAMNEFIAWRIKGVMDFFVHPTSIRVINTSMTHDDKLRTIVKWWVLALFEFLSEFEVCFQENIDTYTWQYNSVNNPWWPEDCQVHTLGRVKSRNLADIPPIPINLDSTLGLGELVKVLTVVPDGSTAIHLVQPIERVSGWGHVQDGKVFVDILGDKEFDGVL